MNCIRAPAAFTEASGTTDLLPLNINFQRAQSLYSAVVSSDAGGSDPALQKNIRQALAYCEASLTQVDHFSIFSPNEIMEDINTGDVKLYFFHSTGASCFFGSLIRQRSRLAVAKLFKRHWLVSEDSSTISSVDLLCPPQCVPLGVRMGVQSMLQPCEHKRLHVCVPARRQGRGWKNLQSG